jgi:hypothetical protein
LRLKEPQPVFHNAVAPRGDSDSILRMTKTLEQRVTVLEKRLAAIEGAKTAKTKPGWLKRAGWAKDDPIYDAAMRLGARYRKSS